MSEIGWYLNAALQWAEFAGGERRLVVDGELHERLHAEAVGRAAGLAYRAVELAYELGQRRGRSVFQNARFEPEGGRP